MMREQARSVLLGVALLARGRADGMAQFGDSVPAFMASVAPLLAFPLVGSVMLLASGSAAAALSGLFASCIALLAPLVLSHAMARLWGRESAWLRYATAFNWCQWTIPVAAAALLLVLRVALGAGMPGATAGSAFIVGLAAYVLWLQCFLARHGLGVSWMKAVATVVVTNAGSALLVFGPMRLLGDGAP